MYNCDGKMENNKKKICKIRYYKKVISVKFGNKYF